MGESRMRQVAVGVVLLVLLAVVVSVRWAGVGTSLRGLSVVEAEVPVGKDDPGLRNYVRARTDIPMYYTNLESSKGRRDHMEATFSSWGELIRVPAIDKDDEMVVMANVDTHKLSLHNYFIGKGKSSGVGAGCLLATKAVAIKMAYESGKQIMLLFEDDQDDTLVPFWRWNLDEIAEQANERHPGWWWIQLQSAVGPGHREFYNAWKLDTETPFYPRDKMMQDGVYTWGAGAILISREGMAEFMRRVFVGADGKFDCLPEVAKTRDERAGVRCHPDNFFWRFPETQRILLVNPPMFVMMINEGTTKIRSSASKGGEDDNSFFNDHLFYHYHNMMAALTASILAKAERTFKRDFAVDDTAEEADMWYMGMTKRLHKLTGGDTAVTVSKYAIEL